MLTSVTTYYDKAETQIRSCYFVDENGMKQGLFLGYNKMNMLVRTRVYDKNLENGPFEERDDKGQLRMAGTMKNGVTHGLLKIYYPNGVIKKECWCQNGLLHGVYKTYYEDGTQKEECVYKEGRSCFFKFYKREAVNDPQQAAVDRVQKLVRERRKALDMIVAVRKFLGFGSVQKEMVYQVVCSYHDTVGSLTAAERCRAREQGLTKE